MRGVVNLKVQVSERPHSSFPRRREPRQAGVSFDKGVVCLHTPSAPDWSGTSAFGGKGRMGVNTQAPK